MADYSACPVWGLDDECSLCNLDPENPMPRPSTISVSAVLWDSLLEWAYIYEYQSPQDDDDTWHEPPSEADWVDQGRELARRLQQEVGERIAVVYHNELTSQDENLR